jgi:formate dehydrogenase subunit gamma
MREDAIPLKDVDRNQAATVRRLAEARATEPGALLPILHAIQDEVGFIPEDAVAIVADVLNLSRAEVHGVLTFYHFFRTRPPGKHTLYVCRAEACQSMGSRALEERIRDRLAIDFHETTADGKFSLEPVYCLGNCACSPAVMVDETVYGRVTPERLDRILSKP